MESIDEPSALCHGVTISGEHIGAGAYGIRIQGIDHSEQGRPFGLLLNLQQVAIITALALQLRKLQ